jgi:hypothetical protein
VWWRVTPVLVAATTLALGTVLVCLTFDPDSHSVSDTVR